MFACVSPANIFSQFTLVTLQHMCNAHQGLEENKMTHSLGTQVD